ALALADLIVVMQGGRIVQTGSAREVYNEARTPFVATLIGDHNVLSGSVTEQANGTVTVTGSGGERFIVPGDAPIGETVWFTVRPDHVSLDSTRQAASSDAASSSSGHGAVNAVQGTAAAVEYLGHSVRVRLETGAGAELWAYLPDEQFSQAP